MRGMEGVRESISLLRKHWKVLVGLTAAEVLIGDALTRLGYGLSITAILTAWSDLPMRASSILGLYAMLGLYSVFYVLAQLLLYVFVSSVGLRYVVGRVEGAGSGLADAARHCVPRLKKCTAAFLVSTFITLPLAAFCTALAFQFMLGHYVLYPDPASDRWGSSILVMVFQAPTLYLSLGFLMAVPVAVFEDLGVFESIGRSWSLMDGGRLTALRVLAPPFLLGWVAGMTSGALDSAARQPFGPPDPFYSFCSWWLSTLAATVFGAWCVVAVALLYLDLRSRPEPRASGSAVSTAEA